MPRPCCSRRIASLPACGLFKPAGVACRALPEVVLTLDELEALRLADLEGLYQEEACGRMKVSRATFARIVESARKKAAQALVSGWAIRIQGGAVEMRGRRRFLCRQCRRGWAAGPASAGADGCPACGSQDVQPAGAGCGCGRRLAQVRGHRAAGAGPRRTAASPAEEAPATANHESPSRSRT